jgi:hypothetical protein
MHTGSRFWHQRAPRWRRVRQNIFPTEVSMVVMGEVALLMSGLPPCSRLGDAHLWICLASCRSSLLPIFPQNGLRALFFSRRVFFRLHLCWFIYGGQLPPCVPRWRTAVGAPHSSGRRTAYSGPDCHVGYYIGNYCGKYP